MMIKNDTDFQRATRRRTLLIEALNGGHLTTDERKSMEDQVREVRQEISTYAQAVAEAWGKS